MALLKVYKVISSLPGTLEPDAIYLVRVGAGYDMYVTDTTGSIAYASNGGGGGAVSSVNGQTGAVTLTKSDIGLGNVDNTSDANKPVSSAQQTALDAKENTANKATTMTGNTASNVLFLTAKAVYDWAVGLFQPLLVSGTNIKTINGSSVLGSGDLTISGSQSFADIQIFTASGVWTKPANARMVEIYLVSGGGGGGSGRRGAAATNTYGGGGGASGAINVVKIQAASLSATENVWIGSGGIGGAGRTADNFNGIAGGNGAASFFGGSGTGATAKVSTNQGQGGDAGAGAQNSNTSSFLSYMNGIAIAANTYSSGTVGPSSLAGLNLSYVNRFLLPGCPGGGITSAEVTSQGSAYQLNAPASKVITFGNAGAMGGGTGENGTLLTNTTDNLFLARPGTGGGSSVNSAGGNGGTGGPGAGGGGGSASRNGFVSGRGGDGGNGFCIVITTF